MAKRSVSADYEQEGRSGKPPVDGNQLQADKKPLAKPLARPEQDWVRERSIDLGGDPMYEQDVPFWAKLSAGFVGYFALAMVVLSIFFLLDKMGFNVRMRDNADEEGSTFRTSNYSTV